MTEGKLKKDGTPSHAGEGGGNELIFKSEEEFFEKIKSYFTRKSKKGKPISIAGLLVHLDIGRSTWSDYGQRYSHTYTLAKLRIEEWWAERLGSANSAGAAFYLKNAFHEHFKDRFENDITSKGESLFNPTPELVATAAEILKELDQKNGRI